MPARMPWKTQMMGPSFGAQPVSPAPPGSISARPSASPYDWAMGVLCYGVGVSGHTLFGHADETAADVTTMAITGNDAGSLAGGQTGLIAVVTTVLGAVVSAADTASQGWIRIMNGGIDGCELHVLQTWLGGLPVGGVVTITSDTPTKMIGGVFGIAGLGGLIGGDPPNSGTGTAAWAMPADTHGADADVVSMIASHDGAPNDPAGYTHVVTMLGSAVPLFCTVAYGLLPAS
jgi:hypothetical protein